ncbi:MAG: hypothetical protein GIW95_10455 [Candidatus Eremiobacteraeota bacterium]|nr:hypothetical protein [Candidatus Eremiobacteraeota bacterium]
MAASKQRPAETTTDFAEIVKRLTAVLKPHAGRLREEATPGRYALFAKTDLSRGRPFYIAWLEARKRYVSLHLMPVYFDPGLMSGASPALKKRKHGKACFNFTSIDAELERDVSAFVAYVMDALPEEKLQSIAAGTVERERAVKERAKARAKTSR